MGGWEVGKVVIGWKYVSGDETMKRRGIRIWDGKDEYGKL
jgi:hypothetical protein